MRTMADSTVADDLPVGKDLYAGYLDGAYANVEAIRARFPNVPVVECVVNPGNNAGVCGDGPPDNGAWPEWVTWVQHRRGAEIEPTIYTDADQWEAGKAAFAAAGVPEPLWWIADWTGSAAEPPPGAVALQYASPDTGSGGHYDLSTVATHWPGVDPEPAPAPPPNHPVPPPDPTMRWREASPLPELSAGVKGPAVKLLQLVLDGAGFGPVATDGMFGPLTGAAVARFQSAHHLLVDQIVGPQTWAALA